MSIVTVYTDSHPTGLQSTLVKTLNDGIFSVMVDSVHLTDREWMISHIPQAKFIKIIRGLLFLYDAEQLNDDLFREPLFSIIPDPNIDVNWMMVRSYLVMLLLGEKDGDYSIEALKEMLPGPTEATLVSASTPFCQVNTNPTYKLRTFPIDSKDYMIFEVIKPFTDKPYTAVIREYSTYGNLPFFSALFICSSWGVYHQDIEFLRRCWDRFEMPGIFDMDKILKEGTEACYPAPGREPMSEPQVYRKTLEEVVAWINK